MESSEWKALVTEFVDTSLVAVVEKMLTLTPGAPNFESNYSFLQGQLYYIRGIYGLEEDIRCIDDDPKVEEEKRTNFAASLTAKLKVVYLWIISKWR